MKDPERLCDRDDASDALREALGLLRAQAPAAELVAHVAQRLTAASSSAPASAFARGKLLAWSTGAAVLAAGGLAVLWTAEPAHAPPQAERVELAVTALPAPEAPLHEPPAQTLVPASAAPASDSAPRTERSRSARAAHVKPASEHTATARAPATASTSPAASSEATRTPAPATPSAAASSETVRAPAAAAAPPATSSRSTQDAPPSAAEAEPQDEASLLFRAKAAEVRDPETALRLLGLHVRYFQRGRYVEERDALLVRVHRRLGHTETAAELAQQFRARYPGSLYRIALPE